MFESDGSESNDAVAAMPSTSESATKQDQQQRLFHDNAIGWEEEPIVPCAFVSYLFYVE
ncbi:unnamed protein product [Anisakis simplex]|uniref:Uncharacterized protein n=1 Tax=Anisakis simplex TaxID=6269 RepID=A0A0M3JM92_ANISI|nr:unnamed protein product [Anisakis simplex]